MCISDALTYKHIYITITTYMAITTLRTCDAIIIMGRVLTCMSCLKMINRILYPSSLAAS